MTEIIYAFSNGNTQKLFTLIDTGFCFSIDGKSSFIRSQQKLHSFLSANPININSSTFRLLPNTLTATNTYEIAFNINSAKYDSIKFQFNFNQESSKIAYYTKVFWHPKNSLQQPIIQSP